MFARLRKTHMIDLTNRTIEEVNGLIQKYASVLELVKPPQQQPYLAVIIDVGIKHVKENHQDLPLDWKIWSIIFTKNKYLNNKLGKESEIPEIIDDFIKHYKDNYKEYIDSLGMYASDFDRDYGFIFKYMS